MLLFPQLPILILEQGYLVLSLLALGKVVNELLVLFLGYFYQVGPSTGLNRNLPRVLIVAAGRQGWFHDGGRGRGWLAQRWCSSAHWPGIALYLLVCMMSLVNILLPWKAEVVYGLSPCRYFLSLSQYLILPCLPLLNVASFFRDEVGSLRVVVRRNALESLKAIGIHLVLSSSLRKHLSVLVYFRMVGLNIVLVLEGMKSISAFAAGQLSRRGPHLI